MVILGDPSRVRDASGFTLQIAVSQLQSLNPSGRSFSA